MGAACAFSQETLGDVIRELVRIVQDVGDQIMIVLRQAGHEEMLDAFGARQRAAAFSSVHELA